ncbi:hypothetical protein ABZ801_11390 [Actinomadura sp. NPDC047616]|uniref:hypothetical protein n=1 Tax=Actinomadura sp. NPDC047616 TaxID=3155914 RepID=UPI0033D4D214
MAFQVYPKASAGPLTVAAGVQSPLVTFQELAGGPPDDQVMFLRLVKLAGTCAPPGGNAPGIALSAADGPPTQILKFPDFSTIRDARGTRIADATWDDQGDGVSRVQIYLTRPGSTWRLGITNNDTALRQFTWVVADNDPETAQPWLHLPRTLTFEAEVNKTTTRTVDVPNLGTGRLTMTPGGLPTGSRFRVDLPADITPNHCGKLRVTFTAPSSAGTTEDRYTAKSNDTQATESDYHNNQIRLTARTSSSAPPPPPPPPPDPPDGWPCRSCSCRNYVAGPNRMCKKCNHSLSRHLPK